MAPFHKSIWQTQDFNYFYSNAFEITLELSCCRHVPSASLVKEWRNNKDAMLKYIEASHMGIKGLVVNERGEPIENAAIVVGGIEKLIRTTPRGEYWRQERWRKAKRFDDF